MKNVLGLMVSESICSSKVAEIFWFCGTQVAPATRLTAITYGAEVSVVGRVVNEKSKGEVRGGSESTNLIDCVVVNCAGSTRDQKGTRVDACRIHGLAEHHSNLTVSAHSVTLGDYHHYCGSVGNDRSWWVRNTATGNKKSQYQKGG